MTDGNTEPLRLYLIAGEPSGDVLGGRLMRALRGLSPRGVSFFGIGGETMEREGLESLIPIRELSVMGLLEILPRMFRLLGFMRAAAI